MIISEKQIMQLIDMAYALASFMHDRGRREDAESVDSFLTAILLQQSEELKVIE